MLNSILNDPEFKVLHRYQQYKILENVYKIVANLNAQLILRSGNFKRNSLIMYNSVVNRLLTKILIYV